MQRMIFVNLPVADVAASTAFYTGLGFSRDPRFSDEACSCIVVSQTIFVMVLRCDRFADFVAGRVGDARQSTSVINCLTAGSRAEVDELVSSALAHGGRPWLDKVEDGPLYGHSFADPDGHAWEVLHMDLPSP
jgi:uncharacterized protein